MIGPHWLKKVFGLISSTAASRPQWLQLERCGNPWWRQQIEAFSVLLAICAGNSLVTGEFPSQRPVTRGFDVFFDLRLNKRLNKPSWGWWFETLSHPLWRQCNAVTDTWTSHVAIAFGRRWCDWTQVTWQGLSMVGKSSCMPKNEWVRHETNKKVFTFSNKIFCHIFSDTNTCWHYDMETLSV